MSCRVLHAMSMKHVQSTLTSEPITARDLGAIQQSMVGEHGGSQVLIQYSLLLEYTSETLLEAAEGCGSVGGCLLIPQLPAGI